MSGSCFRPHSDGLDLFVRLTPRAARDAIDGIAEGAGGTLHLTARVRAVPEKGAANTALERLLAEWLGLPKSAVSVVSGSTSRLKTVRIAGDPQVLARRLHAAIDPGRATKHV